MDQVTTNYCTLGFGYHVPHVEILISLSAYSLRSEFLTLLLNKNSFQQQNSKHASFYINDVEIYGLSAHDSVVA